MTCLRCEGFPSSFPNNIRKRPRAKKRASSQSRACRARSKMRSSTECLQKRRNTRTCNNGKRRVGGVGRDVLVEGGEKRHHVELQNKKRLLHAARMDCRPDVNAAHQRKISPGSDEEDAGLQAV
eukprot:5899966-Pleurochrysis_carterae.AAC.1